MKKSSRVQPVSFNDAEQPLLAEIVELAASEKRSIAAQIKIMCEWYLESIKEEGNDTKI